MKKLIPDLVPDPIIGLDGTVYTQDPDRQGWTGYDPVSVKKVWTKDEARLEIAYDLLENVFSNLCFEKKIQQAEELQDIMRRLILLSQKI